jgi:hypothetical protein
MNPDELMELKDSLIDAQEKLGEVIELVEFYCRATHDRNAEVYLLSRLKITQSKNSEYMSHDLSLDDLIARLDDELNASEPEDPDDY